MKLEDIEKEWERDSTINEQQLGSESANIPKLHHKYYRILVKEVCTLEELTSSLKVLEKDKYLYYTGAMTDEELKQRGWKEFDLRVLKSDSQRWLDSDKDIIDRKLKWTFQNEKVSYIKSILSQINQRNYVIKNIIDFKRFENGSG